MNWLRRIWEGSNRRAMCRHYRSRLSAVRHEIERHHRYIDAAADTLAALERQGKVYEVKLFAVEHPTLFRRSCTKVYAPTLRAVTGYQPQRPLQAMPQNPPPRSP